MASFMQVDDDSNNPPTISLFMGSLRRYALPIKEYVNHVFAVFGQNYRNVVHMDAASFDTEFVTHMAKNVFANLSVMGDAEMGAKALWIMSSIGGGRGDVDIRPAIIYALQAIVLERDARLSSTGISFISVVLKPQNRYKFETLLKKTLLPVHLQGVFAVADKCWQKTVSSEDNTLNDLLAIVLELTDPVYALIQREDIAWTMLETCFRWLLSGAFVAKGSYARPRAIVLGIIANCIERLPEAFKPQNLLTCANVVLTELSSLYEAIKKPHQVYVETAVGDAIVTINAMVLKTSGSMLSHLIYRSVFNTYAEFLSLFVDFDLRMLFFDVATLEGSFALSAMYSMHHSITAGLTDVAILSMMKSGLLIHIVSMCGRTPTSNEADGNAASAVRRLFMTFVHKATPNSTHIARFVAAFGFTNVFNTMNLAMQDADTFNSQSGILLSQTLGRMVIHIVNNPLKKNEKTLPLGKVIRTRIAMASDTMHKTAWLMFEELSKKLGLL
jgi:hypothetical protein